MYYQAVKSKPKVDVRFAEPIKAMIEENPSFGYRTVAHLLGFNKNAVQRIFQSKGWQCASGGEATTHQGLCWPLLRLGGVVTTRGMGC